MTNVAREETVNRRRKREDLAIDQFHADLRAVLDTGPGRRVLMQILDQCHWRGTSYEPSDPMKTLFREGERNVAIWLMAQAEELAPEQWAQAVIEHIRGRDIDRKENGDE